MSAFLVYERKGVPFMELFRLLGTIALQGVDEAKTGIDGVKDKANDLADKLGSAGAKISDFGGKLTTRLSLPITALGTYAVKSAADVKAMNSQFEQTFAGVEEQAKSAMKSVADTSGILQTRLQGIGTSIYAFAKSSGADSAEAMKLMEESLQATADAAAYYDRSLEDTAESLQSFLKGNFENDAALGLSCTETTRNAAAMELFGQKFNDLTEVQKQQTLLKMVRDSQALSGAMGQASRESDGFENVLGNLKESGKQLSAELGEVLLPTVIEIMQGMTSALREFSKMDEGTKKLIITIGGILIAVGPVLTVFGKLVTGIGAFISALGKIKAAIGVVQAGFTALKVAMAASSVGFLPIIAVIGLVVAAGYVLIKNWDSIKEAAGLLKERVGEKFAGIKESMTNAMGAAKEYIGGKLSEIKQAYEENGGGIKGVVAAHMESVKQYYSVGYDALNQLTGGKLGELVEKTKEKFGQIKESVAAKIEDTKESVRSGIEKIKSFFNFKWELPKIKLPHFNVSGKFSVNPPSVPTFGIDWYAKAMDNPMIMNKPTAFGINQNGDIMAGGEAGSEVVSGTDTLMNMIGSAVAANSGISKAELYDVIVSAFSYVLQTFGMTIKIEANANTDAFFDEMRVKNVEFKKMHGGSSAFA